jgi:hypothetical protein
MNAPLQHQWADALCWGRSSENCHKVALYSSCLNNDWRNSIMHANEGVSADQSFRGRTQAR